MTISRREECCWVLLFFLLVCIYAVAQPTSPSPQSPGEKTGSGEKPRPTSIPQSATPNQGEQDASSAALKAAYNSMLFAFGLTVLICLVEIPAKSSMSPKACYGNGSFPLYVALLTVGNCVAALICSQILKLSGQLVYFAAFLNGFFGVFAFQGIMSNTNITFLDKGVLTIEEWTAKARDYAIAAAIKKQARDDDEAKNKISLALTECDEGKLDTYIDNKLGKPAFEEIKMSAATHGENRRLYKALAFADKNLAAATAVTKALKKI
jgi:hypothetical protein